MTHEPPRLLEDTTTESGARALLDAARRVPPIHYDVARGAARFRATLEAGTGSTLELVRSSDAAHGAARASTSTAIGERGLGLLKGGALLWKGAALLVPLLTLWVVGVPLALRSRANPRAASEGSAAAFESRTAPGARALPPTGKGSPPSQAERSLPPALRAAASAQREAGFLHVGRAQAARSTSATASSKRVASAVSSASAVAGPKSAREPDSERAQPKDARLADAPPEAALPPAEAHANGASEQRAREREMPSPTPIDELRSVAQLRLLVVRNPRAALLLLQRLVREQPRGYFLEEREALTVLALAADGQRGTAQQQAAQFLRAHPNSPFADRIRLATSP